MGKVRHIFPMECLGDGCSRTLRAQTQKADEYSYKTWPHAGKGLCFSCYTKLVRNRGTNEKEIKLADRHAAKLINVVIEEDEYWQVDARCREVYIVGGFDPFYPKHNSAPDEAIRVCAGCPVKDKCLKTACEQREEYGVWGGVYGVELRLIVKRYRLLKNKLALKAG